MAGDLDPGYILHGMSQGRQTMRIKPVIATACATVLALLAVPASASQAQSNTVAEKKKAEKKVCRWVDRTGSHIAERYCLTAEEWRKVEEYLAKEF
jgi:hypothetical protein